LNSTSFSIPGWLTSLELSEYAGDFERNGITYDVLFALSEADLEKCGISSLGHRKKILAAIEHLKNGDNPQPPSNQSEIAGSKPSAPPTPNVPVVALGKAPLIDRIGGRFLYISIIAHVVFGLIATWFVVQRIEAKRKLTFQAGAKTTNPNSRAIEHKVQVTKKKNTMSAPAATKRITTTASARVAIPSMPMPMSSDMAPSRMEGMGGAGVSFGSSAMGGSPGGGGGAGGAMPFFGLRQSGVGLEGSFYDFKMKPDQTSNGKSFGRPEYTALIKSFTHSPWGPKSGFDHFKSPAKLYSKFFLFPAIHDSEAGKAFQSPKSAPGGWLAYYKGTIGSSESNSYRFLGFGDNVMIVKVGSRIVLDASDVGYTGEKREQVGAASFPEKNSTPIFAGEWFQLSPLDAQSIEVIVGDEGGIFCAGLFIQKRGQNLKFGKHGLPELPIFTAANLTEEDRSALRKYLSEEMLKGPPFAGRASIFGRH